MARIIVNEGAGPEPCGLGGARVLIGSAPDCDVQLVHPAASGCQFVIERTATGHRVISLLGQLLLNEEPCDVADLQHNDTLRAGESMVLYKNPDARLPAPAPTPSREPTPAPQPAPAAASRRAPEAEPESEPLETLDELEELSELEELAELEELGEIGAADDAPAAAQAGSLTKPPRDDLLDEDEEELVELHEVAAPPASTQSATGSSAVRNVAETAPDGAVRFVRPLPPGHAAPAGPPPGHPGRPPR